MVASGMNNITIKNIDIKTIISSDIIYLDFFMILNVFNYTSYSNQRVQLKKVSNHNIIKTKIHKRIIYFVNGDGMMEYLSLSPNMDVNIRKSMIESLVVNNIIPKDVNIFKTRKELLFSECLSKFCVGLDVKLEKQVFIGKYYVDFLIGSYIIEYDENNHRGYNELHEMAREDYLKSIGYKIIRLSDSISNEENLGKIVSFISKE